MRASPKDTALAVAIIVAVLAVAIGYEALEPGRAMRLAAAAVCCVIYAGAWLWCRRADQKRYERGLAASRRRATGTR